MNKRQKYHLRLAVGIGICSLVGTQALTAFAALPVPAGTIDPTTIPKFVTPLVIPPAMTKTTKPAGLPAADYDIAVRQFKQQILPGGIWDAVSNRSDGFPATTVWGYGRAEDPQPDQSGILGAGVGVGVAPAPNSTFNYPSYTLETISNTATKVRWINDLVDHSTGNYLPHLFPGAVDQTLHWANPPQDCMDGLRRTDCHGMSPDPYTGPVPIITHVHGAHVTPESDGYPEAWWLPNANNIPTGYGSKGDLYDQADRSNTVPGSAFFEYGNQQPATTLWYHDHALGMTRLNVYAGPAGFFLVRGGSNGDDNVQARPGSCAAGVGCMGKLPGPAPLVGQDVNDLTPGSVRNQIREIPIAIQDRTFQQNGELFYPDNRAFFEGLNQAGAPAQFPGAPSLNIPFINGMAMNSDISPRWNPEAFFNTMVVNGSTWPSLKVAPARYRLRLLDGCTSRTLNLSLKVVSSSNAALVGTEIPFYQIGAEQGFLPAVVKVTTGQHTVYDTTAGRVVATDPNQSLLVAPAERADVIVEFNGLPEGTVVRLVNSGPDAPFQGFPIPALDIADPATTGQVMEFVVNGALLNANDAATTDPTQLLLPAEAPLAAETPGVGPDNVRQLTINELSSTQVCWAVDPLTGDVNAIPTPANLGGLTWDTWCATAGGAPAGPRISLLGTLSPVGIGGALGSVALNWSAPITENPIINTTETWELYNTTMDAHPIHLHLVRFKVLNREPMASNPLTGEMMMPPVSIGPAVAADSVEKGYKDTVFAYPGQVTRIMAKFDIAGLYVWHCHIVEHEDNEMMRPYVVRYNPNFPDINGDGKVNSVDVTLLLNKLRDTRAYTDGKHSPKYLCYDLNGDGAFDMQDAVYLRGKL